jgi:hypothetical protein
VPLVNGESVRLFADHVSLTQGVVECIDSFALLNRQQEAAFKNCRNGFDWSRVGAMLVEAMQNAPEKPNRPVHAEAAAARA